MSDEDWQAGLRQVARRVPQRRRDPDAGRTRRTDRRRQLLRDVQRAVAIRWSSDPCRRSGASAGRWRSTPTRCPTTCRGQRGGQFAPAKTSQVQAWSLMLLAAAEAELSRCIRSLIGVRLNCADLARRSLAAWLSDGAVRLPASAGADLPSRPPISLTDALTAIAKDYRPRWPRTGALQLRRFERARAADRQRRASRSLHQRRRGQMDVVASRRAAEGRHARPTCCRNQLAVVVPERSAAHVHERQGPRRPGVQRIALGDPAAVPAGVYAKQYLEKEGCGRRSQPQLVPPAASARRSPRSTSGAADAAIVYRTDARVALARHGRAGSCRTTAGRASFILPRSCATPRRRRSVSSTSCAADAARASSSASASPSTGCEHSLAWTWHHLVHRRLRGGCDGC